MSHVFFIQYVPHNGDCALFERGGREGYTCKVNEAGMFSRAEAEKIVKGSNGDRRMLHVAKVKALAVSHVDAGALAQLHRTEPA